MERSSLLYVVSFGAHVALAAGVISIRGAKTYDDVSVAVYEKAKAEPPKPQAPPPEPPPDTPKAAAKTKAAPKPAPKADVPPPPEAAAAGQGSDVPDYGLSMSGGTGGGGLAVPTGPHGPIAPVASVQVSKKVLAAAPSAAPPECPEPPTKPKVLSLAQPAYTADAREARVSGKVRVELTVDAQGHVASARILEGLGHGLDEAALQSARQATFEPGTRCGKAASTTFVIAMRFAL